MKSINTLKNGHEMYKNEIHCSKLLIRTYILEWFQMKTHFFKQTSGSDKVLAHAIRSNLRQILFENFHG